MAQVKRNGLEEELAAEAARRGLRLTSSKMTKELKRRRAQERRASLDRIERRAEEGQDG